MDSARYCRINSDQLVTRTDRVLAGGLCKRRPSRPAIVCAPTPEERTLHVRSRAPRPPWRAIAFGAMAGIVAGAIAVAQIARHEPTTVAHAEVLP